jgi:hypothetical protein
MAEQEAKPPAENDEGFQAVGAVPRVGQSKGFMSQRQVLLVLFLALGIVLNLLFNYAAWHPKWPAGNSAIIGLGIYLIAVPIVVWRTPGERFLRTLIFCAWLLYLAMLGAAVYLMMTGD